MPDRMHAFWATGLDRRRFLAGAAAGAGAIAAGLLGAGPVRGQVPTPPGGATQFPTKPQDLAPQALRYLYGPSQRLTIAAPEVRVRAAGVEATARMTGSLTVEVGEGAADADKRLLAVHLTPVELAVNGAVDPPGAVAARLDTGRPATPSALHSRDPARFHAAAGDPANRNPQDAAGSYERLLEAFFPASLVLVLNIAVTAGGARDELVNRDPIAFGHPEVASFPPAGGRYGVLNAPVELVRRNDPTGDAVAVVERFAAVVDFVPSAAPRLPGGPPVSTLH